MVHSDHRPLDYWLKLVDRLLNDHFRRILEEHGITVAEWEILSLLSAGSATPGDLERALAPFFPSEEPRVADSLGELVESAWVSAEAERYRLTERGRLAFGRIKEVVDAGNERIGEGISAEDYSTAANSLQRMALNLGWRDPTDPEQLSPVRRVGESAGPREA